MDFSDTLNLSIATPGLYTGGAECWIRSLCRNFDPQRVRVLSIVVECENCISQFMKQSLPPHIKIFYGRRGIETAAEMGCTFLTWGLTDMEKLFDGISNTKVSVVHHGCKSDKTDRRIEAAINAGAHLATVNAACVDLFPEAVRGRVKVIPNGADPERIVPRAGREITRRKLRIADGDRIVGHIGRIAPDKGIENLIAAAEKLPREWRVLLCGPADQWKDERLGDWQARLGSRLIVVPAVHHVGDILAAIDVFALLSPSEAHPLAVTEAWLAGVPTVVSALPWIRSIENEYGAMCRTVDPPEDSAKVALHIENASPEDWTVFLASKRTAFREFTAPRMAYRYEEWLRSITGRN